jgi:hypothetical protein
MTTLNEMIAIIKAENPTIQIGDDDAGYTKLTPGEYDAQVLDWANARLAKEAKLAEAEAMATAKVETAEKLIALGIDPKAFGL